MRLKILSEEANNSKRPTVIFGGFFNDGRVIVYIDGKRYEYITPAYYHEKWKRMPLKYPLKTLNQVKKNNISS